MYKNDFTVTNYFTSKTFIFNDYNNNNRNARKKKLHYNILYTRVRAGSIRYN